MVDTKQQKPKASKGFYTDEELSILKSVNHRLSLLVDYKYQLKSGVMRGIGFAIGASIIGAIIVALILNFVEVIDSPFVNDLINNTSESSSNE